MYEGEEGTKFEELKNLKELNLSYNKLTKVPNLSSCPLTKLEISNNQIVAIEENLNILSLTSLEMNSNVLIEIPERALQSWSKLTGLF